MKLHSLKMLSSLVGLALFSGATFAEGVASPEELASTVKQAIADKDAKAISSLYYWEGVTPDFASQLNESFEFMLEEPVRKADVQPLPDDFYAIQEMDGKSYSQNLEVVGMIRLVYSLEDDSIIATMPYGTKDDRYYFTAPVVVE